MDTSYITEDEESFEIITYDQRYGEVQNDYEKNNAGGCTNCSKRKLSMEPHKKGKKENW